MAGFGAPRADNSSQHLRNRVLADVMSIFGSVWLGAVGLGTAWYDTVGKVGYGLKTACSAFDEGVVRCVEPR